VPVSQIAFAVDPVAFGLPSRSEWQAYRIWDSYYFPRGGTRAGAMLESVESDMAELAPFCIERFCAYLHVGLGTLTSKGTSPAEDGDQNRAVLDRWGERVLGVIHLNANDVPASLTALDTWGKDRRVVGVCFKSSQPGCLVCTHPNFDPLVERCSELGLMIMQHTWFKAGGKDDPGESTPAELAILARRHPRITFISAHAGGDWERGIRAVRDCGNVWVETSGFSPTAGFIEMAVRELGAERIIFGGHFMTRSVGTEFGKIIGADVPDEARRLIFGGNLRRLLAPRLQAK
jgi:predicted TIM-barrel fold metal-dependent hydrolase